MKTNDKSAFPAMPAGGLASFSESKSVERTRITYSWLSRAVVWFTLTVITLLQLTGCYSLGLSANLWLFILIAGLRFVVLLNCDIRRNLAFFVYWVVMDMSFFGWLGVLDEEFLIQLNIAEDDIQFSCMVGALVLFGSSLLFYVSKAYRRPFLKTNVLDADCWTAMPVWTVFTLVALVMLGSFGLTWLCFYLHIGTLGQMDIRLPFKMTGFLNYSRNDAVPFFVVVLLDICHEKRQRRLLAFTFIAYVVWLALETGLRASRGTVADGLLPVIFWMVLRTRLRVSHVFLLATLIGFTMGTANLLTTYRYSISGDTTNRAELLKEIANNLRSDYGFVAGFDFAILRTFPNGLQMAKFQQVMDDRILGNRFNDVIAEGSTADYHTRVIDGVPFSAVHSSGSSLIGDAYLLGGLPFALFTGLLFATLALMIDFNKLGFLTSNPAARANLIKFLFVCTVGGFWILLFRGLAAVVMQPALFATLGILFFWYRGTASRRRGPFARIRPSAPVGSQENSAGLRHGTHGESAPSNQSV